jgi:hypothetical protein
MIMMTRDNPFPGMNPFLERHWADVHTRLIAYICDEIAGQLPSELNARAEEHVTTGHLFTTERTEMSWLTPSSSLTQTSCWSGANC